MLDWRGSSPRSTLLEKLVSQFTQNVQFSFVAGVAVLGPLGASVDVTEARRRNDLTLSCEQPTDRGEEGVRQLQRRVSQLIH